MLIKYLLFVLSGFTLAAAAVFLLNRFSALFNLPRSHGISLCGGLGLGWAFIFFAVGSISVFNLMPSKIYAIIIPALLMLVFGLLDDYKELSVFYKLLTQIIASAVLIFSGVHTEIVYLSPLANIIITFIWVVGITNAFNHLDVVDGVAAGAAVIISLAFFAIAILNHDMNSAFLSLALAGICAGFLIFNLPPAKVYLGNSGSHFLGFVLASLALGISYAPMNRKLALLSPIIILGLPIFDTAFLIWLRLKQKKLPFNKSADHPALRFVALGYSKQKVLLAMSGLCLFFVFCGLLLSKADIFFAVLLIIDVIAASLFVAFKMAKIKING